MRDGTNEATSRGGETAGETERRGAEKKKKATAWAGRETLAQQGGEVVGGLGWLKREGKEAHRCFRANGNGHAIEKAGTLQFAESTPSPRLSSLFSSSPLLLLSSVLSLLATSATSVPFLSPCAFMLPLYPPILLRLYPFVRGPASLPVPTPASKLNTRRLMATSPLEARLLRRT